MTTQSRTQPTSTEQSDYAELRDRGYACAKNGQLEKAHALFLQALDAAQGCGTTLEDRAFCNLAAIEIELRKPFDPLIPRLREVLVRGAYGESARLAAYHLARIYDLRKEHKKGLFYARVARERAEQLKRSDWISSSHNQVGNLLMADSRFDEAASEFERALCFLDSEESRCLISPEISAEMSRESTDDSLRALILDNLAYCRFVEGDTREGFSLAFRSLRLLRRNQARWWESLPHLTLCHGYLEIERVRPAIRHGIKALALADEVGDPDAQKNALFLMGEACNMAGNTAAAFEYFSELQEKHYPDHSFLPDFLLAVDVRQLVNLKA